MPAFTRQHLFHFDEYLLFDDDDLALLFVAGAPGVVVNLDALTLASSVLDVGVQPGAVIVTLDALTLAGSVLDVGVQPGAVVVTLDALTLTSSVLDVDADTPALVLVDALTLASSVTDISAKATLFAALGLSLSLLDITVTRGAAAVVSVDFGLRAPWVDFGLQVPRVDFGLRAPWVDFDLQAPWMAVASSAPYCTFKLHTPAGEAEAVAPVAELFRAVAVDALSLTASIPDGSVV